MVRILILGGTGYTGGTIAREALERGHEVTSFSRSVPAEPVPGIRYETGPIEDALPGLIPNADVVIASLAPRGELEGTLRGIYQEAARIAAASGARLGVIGGWSALRLAEGAPRTAFTADVPGPFAAEARAMAQVADDLATAAPAGLDWFYVSPAANYGAHVPGEATGRYRTGGELALFDEQGRSAVSGADFAKAIVDEIEQPAHSRVQFGVAY